MSTGARAARETETAFIAAALERFSLPATEREQDVLDRRRAGLSYGAIAEEMDLSPTTARRVYVRLLRRCRAAEHVAHGERRVTLSALARSIQGRAAGTTETWHDINAPD